MNQGTSRSTGRTRHRWVKELKGGDLGNTEGWCWRSTSARSRRGARGRGDVRDIVKTPVQPYSSARWAEQHAETYWDVLRDSCRQLLGRAGPRTERIIAVALTTQRGTYVNVDRDGTALRPAIVWLDQRKASIDGLIPPLTVPLLKAAGMYGFVEYVTRYCRSNWIRQNQPEIWEKTHKFLCLSGT
jgi:sugar (pentulose or hexulose) kinase